MEHTIKLDEEQFDRLMQESSNWRSLMWEVLKAVIELDGGDLADDGELEDRLHNVYGE